MNVSYEKKQRFVEVTWDRPPLNVFDIKLLRELDEALSLCTREVSSDVIVLRGAGERAFSAGVRRDRVGDQAAWGGPDGSQ